jgi:hypothetical protein
MHVEEGHAPTGGEFSVRIERCRFRGEGGQNDRAIQDPWPVSLVNSFWEAYPMTLNISGSGFE